MNNCVIGFLIFGLDSVLPLMKNYFFCPSLSESGTIVGGFIEGSLFGETKTIENCGEIDRDLKPQGIFFFALTGSFSSETKDSKVPQKRSSVMGLEPLIYLFI